MRRITTRPHILSCMVVIFIYITSVVGGGKDMKALCELCKSMADVFHEKLKATAKSNFGGGNTHWEEKSLGSYAFSETRLLEITETLCSKTSDEKKCHSALESNEELIEHFWFKVFKKNPDSKLYQWLCLDEKKATESKDGSMFEPVCCGPGLFGPQCSPCSGGSETPCSGKGKCDGDATRGGTGKCLCDTGYRGDVCGDCSDGYYNKNTDQTNPADCQACHISCSSCSAGEPKDCLECRKGYIKDEKNDTHICQDVDECQEKGICTSGQYCSNTIGSYVCMTCDPACDQCLGAGADKCVKCKKGYRMDGNKCVDPDAPEEEEEDKEEEDEKEASEEGSEEKDGESADELEQDNSPTEKDEL